MASADKQSKALVIIGIHSNALGDDSTNDISNFSSRRYENSADWMSSYIAGHAWVTVNRDGVTEFYGLWPDSHPAVDDNGPLTDIRIGLERRSSAEASRYYRLSAAQVEKLDALLAKNVEWGYTHNCSSWAHEIIYEVVGEDVDADDYLGLETPRELARNIQMLEVGDPTSEDNPKDMTKN